MSLHQNERTSAKISQSECFKLSRVQFLNWKNSFLIPPTITVLVFHFINSWTAEGDYLLALSRILQMLSTNHHVCVFTGCGLMVFIVFLGLSGTVKFFYPYSKALDSIFPASHHHKTHLFVFLSIFLLNYICLILCNL